MSSFDDDEVVGSLLDRESDGFGESISSIKRRREGRPGYDDGDAPSTSSFDRTFDQAFRSRRRGRIDPALKRAAREEGFGSGSLEDRAARSTAIYQRLTENRTPDQRPRTRIVLDGATDEVQVIEPGEREHYREPDDLGPDLDEPDGFDDDGFEPDEPARVETPKRTRAELLAVLADLDRQAAALAATTSPSAPARTLPPRQVEQASTRDASPVQVGPSGDTLDDLLSLRRALGIGEQAQEIPPRDLPTIDPDPDDDYEGVMLDQETDEAHEFSSTNEPATERRAYIPAAKTDDHCSPKCIARALFRTWGDTDLDPCASKSRFAYVEAATQWFGPREDDIDGLNQPWFGKAYINPPYGREIRDWIDKIVLELDSNAEMEAAIALLPIRSDVPWFHDDVLRGATAVCFIRGRLKFGGSENSAPFPSIVVLWGDQYFDAFKQAFEVDKDPDRDRPLGTVVDLRSRDAVEQALRVAMREEIASAIEMRIERGEIEDMLATRELVSLVRSGALEAA